MSVGMSIGLFFFVCLAVFWSAVCLSVRLSICPSFYLSVCLSVRLSIFSSFYLFVCLSVSLSICQSVYLSVCLSVRLSVSLSICLSVCLSVGQSNITQVSLLYTRKLPSPARHHRRLLPISMSKSVCIFKTFVNWSEKPSKWTDQSIFFLSVRLSVCPSVCLSICLFVFFCRV